MNYMLNEKKECELYEYVKNLPIIDYHNHLCISDIKNNVKYTNIYDLWVKADPYKHRVMRMCGISEELITGDASSLEKFKAWCSVYNKLIGSPLYIWSKAELEDIFDIHIDINSENAGKIYDEANDFLSSENVDYDFFMNKFNILHACPCGSITDNAFVFENDSRLSLSLRGDDMINPSKEFIKTLEKISLIEINDLEAYKRVLKNRVEAFAKSECTYSDHSLDSGFKFYADDNKNDMRFKKILCGEKLSKENSDRFASHMLLYLTCLYEKLNFTLQLHIGAERLLTSRLRNIVGPAGGFATIGKSLSVTELSTFFNEVEKKCALPKIILFPLNPSDYASICTLSGSYSKDGVSGLITCGPAWWWCDHTYGIQSMLENISAFGLISNFVGMTTDSRSFLSFSRHDYFRRNICRFIAKKLNENEIAADENVIKKLLEDICFNNAKRTIKK